MGQYHTHAEIGADLLAAQTNYPDICQRHNLGLSVQGREIWAVCISDDVGVDEDEPEFKYISTMHGDEIMGVEMCMNLVDYLTTNYATNQRVTNIVNSMELWIVPLMNPDGFVLNRRENANWIDLNRDFPDIYTSPSNTPDGRAAETAVIMNWSFGRSFTLAANLHGGALVANYPFDGNASGSSVYTPTPDDDMFVWISEEYSQHNLPMWNSSIFYHGITNGADWYVVYGGMQDWSYRWMGCNEITIEIGPKQPPSSQIPVYWDDNRESMLAYLETCLIGVRGLVTDASTGDPLAATVRVVGRDHDVFTDPDVGDYHRMLMPGTYDLMFEAEGYDPHLEEDVLVASGDATRVDVALWSGTNLIYPNGGETLTAGSSTLVTWTGNPNAQFHVQYTANANDVSSTTDGFETGTIGGVYTNDPSHPWVIVTNPTHQGFYAAKAGSISHEQQTELTRTAGGGLLSFWYSVSSEAGWDFFRFYVDDVVMVSDSGTGGGWTRYTTTLDPGSHELKWEYSKDQNTSVGSDTVWIDDITVTADNTIWTDITTATPVGATSTPWTPGEEGSDYKVRVRSVLGGGLYGQWDESASTFTVQPGEIPTVSEWGFVVLMLLICSAGSVVLMRRRPQPAFADHGRSRGWVRLRSRGMTGTKLLLALAMGLCWVGANGVRGEQPRNTGPAEVRGRQRAGSTPLHLAARSLRLEAARSLLDAGADVKAVDQHGATALHLALRAGYDTEKARTAQASLVELLLKHGADVKAVDDQGKTALHIAAMMGRAELLDRLLKASADLSARDAFGRTALHDAAMYNQIPVIEWLVAHEVDIHAKDKEGNTPLHCAVLRYRKEATEKLIALGAEVDARNNRGATPLHLTGMEGPEEPEVDRMMTDVAEVLIAKGADVNATDRSGFTPLHYAEAKMRSTLSTILREHGAAE